MSAVCPPAIRRSQRRAQGGRRGDAPAHPGAAGRGRADGVRPDRRSCGSRSRASRAISSCWSRPAWSSASARAPGRSSAWPSAAAAPSSRATLIARLDPKDPMIARDRDRLAAVRTRARRGGAGLFPRARRAVGPHPQAARRRRGGRGRDPRRARRAAVPLAARSRHRHRPHPGNVRPRSRARARHRSLARHAAARARPHRARGLAPLQRAAGRHLRSRGAGGLLRRRHHPSGAALPRRRRARDPRGGARAGARRPAAGGRFRAARSGIPARGARAPPARLCRRGRDAMDDRRGPRRHAAPAACRRSPAPTARSRCRSGSRAIRACAIANDVREVA